MVNNLQVIPFDEISFNSTSYVDPNGRVFTWQDRVFRAIDSQKKPFYSDLLEKDVFKQLCSEGKIIGTRPAPYSLRGYNFLLEHDRVQFLTYCTEWPPEMLRDAALLTLDTVLRLMEHNMTLQDAYPWNVQFQGSKPIFIDIGSIVEKNENFIWKAYDQFMRFFMYPLYLHAFGKGKVARLLLTDYWEGITDEMFLGLVPPMVRGLHPGIFTRITVPYLISVILRRLSPSWEQDMIRKTQSTPLKIDAASAIRFIKMLYKDISSVKIKDNAGHWSHYYNKNFASSEEAKKGLERKEKVISDILERCKPETLLDMGANTGHFSFLASRKGIKVIAWEKNEACANSIYKNAKEKGFSITPLIIDMINPTPAFGWCGKQFPPAIDRMRSDMVLCLALIHHLVFKQWQNFSRIIETLDAVSRKWIIVEFIPKDDKFIRPLWEERFSFYTLDNFITTLEQYFKHIRVFDSYPEGRKLILCEKHH